MEPELEFKRFKNKWEAENEKYNSIPTKEEFMEAIEKEEEMGPDIITDILDEHLKKQGFLTIREKNYVGYNRAPFDLTAGDQNKLKIFGFEIKSDKDRFKRLADQLNEYAFICEGIYLVLHNQEAPDWLPDWLGILRVNKNKDIYIENTAYSRNPFEISTGYEWDQLAAANGLGHIKDRLGEYFKELIDIRKNILFNRYFGILTPEGNSSSYTRFFPLSDKQKSMLIGFDVPYHLRNLNKDVTALEKRFDLIKDALRLTKKQQRRFTRRHGNSRIDKTAKGETRRHQDSGDDGNVQQDSES